MALLNEEKTWEDAYSEKYIGVNALKARPSEREIQKELQEKYGLKYRIFVIGK